MNEQMIELAKQAGLKFPSETELSPAERKFAELIVKEILRITAAAPSTVKTVKKYFGVSE